SGENDKVIFINIKSLNNRKRISKNEYVLSFLWKQRKDYFLNLQIGYKECLLQKIYLYIYYQC
ncbi:hypothetical protein JIN33_003704, partial [Acinetobacter baumannii]